MPGTQDLKPAKPVLILGVGNILRTDEGVGVHVVEFLKRRKGALRRIDILDGGTAGYDLLPHLLGRRRIIIVDAVVAESPPGTLLRPRIDEIDPGCPALSLHQVAITQVLDALRLYAENPEIKIVGIVPQDIRTLGMNLTPAVQKAVPLAAEKALDLAGRPYCREAAA